MNLPGARPLLAMGAILSATAPAAPGQAVSNRSPLGISVGGALESVSLSCLACSKPDGAVIGVGAAVSVAVSPAVAVGVDLSSNGDFGRTVGTVRTVMGTLTVRGPAVLPAVGVWTGVGGLWYRGEGGAGEVRARGLAAMLGVDYRISLWRSVALIPFASYLRDFNAVLDIDTSAGEPLDPPVPPNPSPGPAFSAVVARIGMRVGLGSVR